MDEHEGRPDAGRLAALKKENQELRKQVSQLGGNEEDMHSYRIFVEARKKFLGWIGIGVGIVTVFGLVSVTNIINRIEADIEGKLKDNIVKKVATDFRENHAQAIIDETMSTLLPKIESEVDEAVRGELIAAAQKTQQQATGSQEVSFVQALEKSYEEERYYVVAGSSPRREDLAGELDRVKEKVGNAFDEQFPSVEIYPPFGDNRNYALIVGANLPFTEAKEVQQRAIGNGFRDDTFLWRASRANLERK